MNLAVAVRSSLPVIVSAMHSALRIASSVASAAARNRLVMAAGASMRTFDIVSFSPMWLAVEKARNSSPEDITPLEM